ncbi:MAG TPA: hypothetical protein VKC17_05135 [Sphingomicrobium sp.]|nr:hypothetical protein [Sphingomicrobium sp.]
MTFTRVALIASATLLVGCGKMADLKPAAGQSLPVKPLMAKTTPTPAQLLTPPAYAAPERIDELMKKSQPREADKFDLPPPSGGVAPALPVGAESQPATDDTGPASPK